MSPNDDSPCFTVFTPTHNRAHTLTRVFDSLDCQTFRDFEWLIVDDGSTDGTGDLVQAWKQAANFQIRYIRQDHSGKHVAFNRGVGAARGRLFLTLDSDDECLPQALERLNWHWESIPDERRDTFSAVTSLVADESGNLVGAKFPKDVLDSEALAMYFIYRVPGEKWGFQRTDVLRDFPFPEPEGVTFVSEAVVWFAISRRYQTRFVNEVLRTYHQAHATESNLSALTVATAKGRLVFHQEVLERYLDYVGRAPALIVKSAINYSRYSFLTGRGPVAQVRAIRGSKGRLLALLSLPAGVVAHARDRRRVA